MARTHPKALGVRPKPTTSVDSHAITLVELSFPGYEAHEAEVSESSGVETGSALAPADAGGETSEGSVAATGVSLQSASEQVVDQGEATFEYFTAATIVYV